jgi:hypothetical protein
MGRESGPVMAVDGEPSAAMADVYPQERRRLDAGCFELW